MYSLIQEKTEIRVAKDGETLRTPMGREVTTTSSALALRLLADLNEFGEDPSDCRSIVAYHFARLDFFSVMPRSDLEGSVTSGFKPETDWTFNCPTAAPEMLMKWIGLFGTYSIVGESGRRWLSTLNLTQLCAVCVLGRALESVNIPRLLAKAIPHGKLAAFAKAVDGYYPYVGRKELRRYFDSFLFYFHLEKTDGETESPAPGKAL